MSKQNFHVTAHGPSLLLLLSEHKCCHFLFLLVLADGRVSEHSVYIEATALPNFEIRRAAIP